jgi:hypothetical protein
MFNPITTKYAVHPSIKVLALLGPRAMDVIARNKSIALIAAHETTLGPKVGRFEETRQELKELVRSYKKDLVVRSTTEIAGLDAVTRGWSAHLQLGNTLALEDIGIDAARTPEGVLDNARSAMKMLKEHSELPFAEQALSDIETTYSSAKAAYDAAQAGRVAVQVKQNDLRAYAVEVQKELVKLRTVVRITLGRRHADYQRLRLIVASAEVDAAEETPPQADVSPASGNGSASG